MGACAAQIGKRSLRFELSPISIGCFELSALSFLTPCALGHFCFIIRNADKALHLMFLERLTDLSKAKRNLKPIPNKFIQKQCPLLFIVKDFTDTKSFTYFNPFAVTLF